MAAAVVVERARETINEQKGTVVVGTRVVCQVESMQHIDRVVVVVVVMKRRMFPSSIAALIPN